MKEYSTYIFDLDGTLLDTLNDLYQSVNYAMNECGFPLHTLEDVRRFVGNGVRMLMIRAIPDGDKNPRFEEAFDIFRKHYLQHSLDTTHPYPGIEEMLSQLKKRGKRLAVVSNKLDVATKELISHFFGNLIDVAIGENEAAGVRKKPAPDTVDEALRQLGVGKEGAVTWICKRQSTASCHVSVYYGDSETAISLKPMVLPYMLKHLRKSLISIRLYLKNF